MIDGHKMTDNEIIKALECCSWQDEKNCSKCPLDKKETNTFCTVDLMKNTLELINRQKAEIKELNRVIKKFKATKERHRTEIARLAKLLIKWKKVFIPKDYDPNDDLLFLSVDVKDVNKLLKEMVGE